MTHAKQQQLIGRLLACLHALERDARDDYLYTLPWGFAVSATRLCRLVDDHLDAPKPQR